MKKMIVFTKNITCNNWLLGASFNQNKTQRGINMKKSIIAVLSSIAFASAPVAYATDANDSVMGNSNGETAQMRNIDKCVKGQFNGTVKTYDYQTKVKLCTMAGNDQSGKPVPEQKFKTPFR